jgi:hypothetical protein
MKNNMLNSNKTWEERFDEQNFTDAWAEDESNRIKQFISDIRKRDMEALIGIMKDKFAPSDNFLTIDLIKDYYEN